jgi:hypothetical protein
MGKQGVDESEVASVAGGTAVAAVSGGRATVTVFATSLAFFRLGRALARSGLFVFKMSRSGKTLIGISGQTGQSIGNLNQISLCCNRDRGNIHQGA